MAAPVFRSYATGNGTAIAQTFACAIGETYRVISVMLNLTVAAPTVNELFTITLNAVDGPAYDTLLYSKDLSIGSITDLVWQPERMLYIKGGDSIDVAWPNGGQGGIVWALLITMQEVGYASGA